MLSNSSLWGRPKVLPTGALRLAVQANVWSVAPMVALNELTEILNVCLMRPSGANWASFGPWGYPRKSGTTGSPNCLTVYPPGETNFMTSPCSHRITACPAFSVSREKASAWAKVGRNNIQTKSISRERPRFVEIGGDIRPPVRKVPRSTLRAGRLSHPSEIPEFKSRRYPGYETQAPIVRWLRDRIQSSV